MAFLLSLLLATNAYARQVDQQFLSQLTDQVQGKSCKYKEEAGGCVQRGFLDSLLRRHDKENCIIDAARCLGEMGNEAKPAVPVLIQALRNYRNVETGDGILPVRSSIAEALGAIGDESAIQPLMEVLSSADPVSISSSASLQPTYKPVEKTSHAAVVEALGMFGPKAKRAVPLIVPVLKYSSEVHEIKYAPAVAAEALGKIKDPTAIPHLVESLDNPICNAEAAEALGQFGPQAIEVVPALEEKLGNSDVSSRFGWSLKRAIKEIKQGKEQQG